MVGVTDLREKFDHVYPELFLLTCILIKARDWPKMRWSSLPYQNGCHQSITMPGRMPAKNNRTVLFDILIAAIVLQAADEQIFSY